MASRLEAANKQLGTRVLVSAALAEKVENFRGRPVGDLMLRGRTGAIRAFAPVQIKGCDPIAESYQKAFALLEPPTHVPWQPLRRMLATTQPISLPVSISNGFWAAHPAPGSPRISVSPDRAQRSLLAQAVWKGVGMGGIVSATPVSRSWSTDLNRIGSRRTLGRLMALI